MQNSYKTYLKNIFFNATINSTHQKKNVEIVFRNAKFGGKEEVLLKHF